MLHVDDDPLVLGAVARTLSAAGFAVASERTGSDALAAARRTRPDLVILDVDLPGLSGFEVCVRLRADRHTRDVPILHLSGARVDLRDRVHGLEGGADAYLVQPVPPEELVAVARALVTRAPSALRARRAGEGREAAAAREDALHLAAQLLRAPLSAVAINASGLAASAEDPVARARARAVVEAQAEAAQALADLVELAYLDSQRALLALEARRPSELVEKAIQRATAAAADRGVGLVADAPSDPTVWCDPARMENALAALIGRCVRSAPEAATIVVRACAEGTEIRFSVEGDGPPAIDAERAQLDRAFWSSRVRRNGSHVLELALVRAVIEAHRGRIWFDRDRESVHVAIPLSGATR